MGRERLGQSAQKLGRAYGLTDLPITGVAPELVPVVIVGDLTSPAEHDAGDIRYCVGNGSQGGAASNYAHVQLLNPPGSGITVIVQTLVVAIETAGDVQVRLYDTPLTTATTRRFRDTRITGTPVGQARTQNETSRLGTSVLSLGLVADASEQIQLDFVLKPGTGILVSPYTADVQCTAGWLWVEMLGA